MVMDTILADYYLSTQFKYTTPDVALSMSDYYEYSDRQGTPFRDIHDAVTLERILLRIHEGFIEEVHEDFWGDILCDAERDDAW